MAILTERTYFGNTALDYLIFLLTLSLGLFAVRLAGQLVGRRVAAWSERRESAYGEVFAAGLRRYALPAAYFLVVYLCARMLTLAPPIEKALRFALAAFATYLGAAFLSKLIVLFFTKLVKGDGSAEGAIRWMAGIAKAVVWIVAVILFLDNIGVRINSLVTGLGIGGVAVAFAAQSVLADIFCFFTIFFDKPFVIGDFIAVGTQMGTVEHIGLKTTRLRALGGEQLILSNADLTGSRVSNYKTLRRRRVVLTIPVAFQTPPDLLRAIPGAIAAAVSRAEGATFDRAHFAAYGAYSLNFEIVYYVESPEYMRYMDVNQEVNLLIAEALAGLGVALAYPTQRVYMGGDE